MTNDEIQRTMEVIIRQQEAFAESMEQADARMNRLETTFVGMFNLVSENTKAIELLGERIGALAAAQATTDDRLNIMIATVQRSFSDKRNGESRT